MIFPLLLHNPVMAAKYQAMVAAAESARRNRPLGQARIRAGRPGCPRRPVRPRQGPRRLRRVAAALDPLMAVHGADWDPVAASGGRLSLQSRRQPSDQRVP